VTPDEVRAWELAAENVAVPFDDELGVHEQSRGFTRHAVWDFEHTPEDGYPLLLHYPYFDLYRKQVVKQADLVLAMQTRGDRFTAEQKAANFAYYEAVTVRDSSLSACTQAVMAAEVGALDLAYAYTAEAAFMDLHDLEHNTRDGLHMASLAGAWMALVFGFGGLRDHGQGRLIFAPRLPEGLTKLAFTIRHLGQRLRVTTDGREVTYTLFDHGSVMQILHHGQELTVTSGQPLTVPVPPPPEPPKITQPYGREPRLSHR
jgi:alpha,alpha-trehalose phosphorylase